MAVTARVWAEIDPAALRANVDFARRYADTGVVAVVKANAYGHGVEIVVPALRDVVDFFAVANVEEAAVVRTLSPDRDVILLSPCLPEERATAVSLGAIATVSSAAEAEGFGEGARVSLKVDTGMGRIGVWHTEALVEIERILSRPELQLHSIATHLPVADEDDVFTLHQLADFADFAGKVKALAPELKFHALNSAGICAFPESAFDFVRAGLLLYGSASIPAFQSRLRPALAWKSRIILVRDVPEGRSVSYGRTFVTPGPMRIATIAAGYADGYPRQASGQGAYVLIDGQRCPLLGRVTMDQILVDVTGAPTAGIGDEVVLIGTQGNSTIYADQVAQWGGTIAWHIFTGIGGRTKRVSI